MVEADRVQTSDREFSFTFSLSARIRATARCAVAEDIADSWEYASSPTALAATAAAAPVASSRHD